jgi:anthranilate phosphoribosyltransferase
MQPNNFNYLIELFNSQQNLTESSLPQFLSVLTDPKSTEQELADLTAAWRNKGETSQEIALIASNVLAQLERICCDFEVLDCCGTGGDNSNTFNISTTCAFIAASGGLKVAKHGGRKTTSASGSIDFLEALSLPSFTEPSKIKKLIETKGLAFIASPALHNILGRWKTVCRKMEFSGQTGLIGTLTNPVKLTQQIIGVPKPEWGPLMIEALRLLGRKKALVIHGEPKLDEASLCGKTFLWLLENNMVSEFVIDPLELGFEKHYELKDLRGGSPEENAHTFLEIINGGGSKAIKETLFLNSALMFWLSDKVKDIKDGIALSEQLISSGQTLRFFEDYKTFVKSIET